MEVINGVRSIYGIKKWLRYKNVHQLANIDFILKILLNWCDPNFFNTKQYIKNGWQNWIENWIGNWMENKIGWTHHVESSQTEKLDGNSWEQHEKYVWAFSACIFGLLIGSTIVYSVAFPSHFVGIRHVRNITCVSNDII